MAKDLSTEEIEQGIKGLLFGNDSSVATSPSEIVVENKLIKAAHIAYQKPQERNDEAQNLAKHRKKEKAKLRKNRKQEKKLDAAFGPLKANQVDKDAEMAAYLDQLEHGQPSKTDLNPTAGQQKQLMQALSKQDKEVGLANDVKAMLKKEQQQLEDNFIFPLKKKNDKFPKAKFFCRLCDYHCDDMQHCMRHVKDTRHSRLKQLRDGDVLLKNLPPPTASHIAAIDEFVSTISTSEALGSPPVDNRWEVLETLRTVINKKLKDVVLVAYGSSVTGFGLKCSDLNVDITYPTGMNPANVLITSLEALQESDEFSSVESDFSAKIPSITVTMDKVVCRLGVDNKLACQTTRLLHYYSDIDPRVRHLAVVFRHWAKLSKIDNQEEGTLPSYSFALMTVYFLQQVQPSVLPCLHYIPMLKSSSKKENAAGYFTDIENLSKVWKTRNTMSVGELWINLLKFYSVDFDMAEVVVSIRQPGLLLKKDKKWGSKRIAIEDPFSTKRNLTRSVSHSELFEYIFDCTRSAYQYFGIPQLKDGPMITRVELHYATNSIPDQESVDSQKPKVALQLAHSSVDQTKSGNSQNIVDSVDGNSDNISGTLEEKLDYYIQNGSKSNVPMAMRSKSLSQSGEDNDCDLETLMDSFLSGEREGDDSGNDVINKSETCEQSIVENTPNSVSDSSRSDANSQGVIRTRKMNDVDKFIELSEKRKHSTILYNSEGAEVDVELISKLAKEDLLFNLSSTSLNVKEGPPIVCKICQKKGHLKRNCPEEKLPKLAKLPKMNKTYDALLTTVLEDIPHFYGPSREEVRNREDIVYNLERYLREIYPRMFD